MALCSKTSTPALMAATSFSKPLSRPSIPLSLWPTLERSSRMVCVDAFTIPSIDSIRRLPCMRWLKTYHQRA